MPRLSLIVLAVAGLGLLVAFPLAYASARSDVIAEGVRIEGLDVGGLDAGEARDRLRAHVREPARADVVVRHGDETFTLTAGEAGVRLDIDAAVDEALESSRSGGPWARTIRGVLGGSVDDDVGVAITHDAAAVRAFATRVADELDADARDADIDPRDGTLTVIEAAPGFRTDRAALVDRLTAVIGDPGRRDAVEVPGEAVEPDTTDAELREGLSTYLIVDRDDFRLRLYEDLELSETYPIGVGKAGHRTPSGSYEITSKQVDPTWHVPDQPWAGDLAGDTIPGDDPRNPLEERWLGIARGIGIHGTDARDSIGSRASHGCIRMLPEDVVDLYDVVPEGTSVYIA